MLGFTRIHLISYHNARFTAERAAHGSAMPEQYYQNYGPIQRRRASGELEPSTPPPDREPPPDPRPSRRRPHRRSSLRLLIVFGLVIFIAVALPFVANLIAGGQTLDGLSLQGQAIGGLDREHIRAALDQRYGAFVHAPLTLTFEGRTWQPTLDQLGIGFDLDHITDELLTIGRRGGPIERTQELWALTQGGLDSAPRLQLNMTRLHAYLDTIALEIEQPPRDAALSIAAGKVVATPARPGRQVLVDATAHDIAQALQQLAPQEIVLRTRLLDPVLGDAAVAHAADTARALLKAPLLLKRGPQRWIWAPDKIAELLVVRANAGHMTVTIDPDRLTKAIIKLAQLADSPSAEPRVAFRNGRLRITQPGQTGWRLRQTEAANVISETLQLTRREVELPSEALTPQVTANILPTLGIVEVVGEGRSSFAGSAAYRITNIKAGAARIDGVLIPPDTEFSFNTQLGAVDETNGFVKGYAVIGNRTQLEWGGGVCQDSTTLFRAAFWAGLPITERHGHPFYIRWYDAFSYPQATDAPGMDATIYTGVQDLKFHNDTGHWLLVETTIDEQNNVLTVRLYGTKPERTVTLRGPEISNEIPAPVAPVYVDDPLLPSGTLKQTDTARKGMEIRVYRLITERGVARPPELFRTIFKAWPNVFVRGVG